MCCSLTCPSQSALDLDRTECHDNNRSIFASSSLLRTSFFDRRRQQQGTPAAHGAGIPHATAIRLQSGSNCAAMLLQVSRLSALLEASQLQAALSSEQLVADLADERARAERLRAVRDDAIMQRCAGVTRTCVCYSMLNSDSIFLAPNPNCHRPYFARVPVKGSGPAVCQRRCRLLPSACACHSVDIVAVDGTLICASCCTVFAEMTRCWSLQTPMQT